MPIFKKLNGKYKMQKVIGLGKEKTLQVIIEENLQEMLDMYFLETEYPTTFGGRIDTLAVDSSGAPVIIEYKLSKNENIINQALSYLKWLRAQKVDFFEMLVQKRLGKEIAERLKIDWKNPRVICIAESYSKFDIDTVEVVPLRIELFLYRNYENDLLSLDPVTLSTENKIQSIGVLPASKTLEAEETSIESLLVHASSETALMFQELRQRVFALDEAIIEKVTKYYVAYRVTKNFAEVVIGKNQIKIHMRPLDYIDPQKMVDKIPDGYN